jgi:AraC-like DNA-binding protein
MATADLLLRLIGVTALACLCAILIRIRARGLHAMTSIGLTASVGAFLLTSMAHAGATFGILIYPLTAACSTHPVWFWLAAQALFSDAKHLERRDLMSLAAMALMGVVYQSALPSPPALPTDGVRALGIVFSMSSMTFACLAPLTVFLGAAGDLDARRRRIRRWFVPAVALYLALVVAVQLIVLVRGSPTPKPLVLLNLLVINGVAMFALSRFVRVHAINWFELVAVQPPLALSRLEQGVLDRLKARFGSERLYTRESLTIGALAELLGTQEHVLRRVIHHGLGFRSFCDFLHAHRLPEAARRLRDPAARRVPVLTIALEAGYGSIGPFNRAFRERYGMTPTQYRRTDCGIGQIPSEIGEPPAR